MTRRELFGLAGIATLIAASPSTAAQDPLPFIPQLLTEHVADLTLRDISLCEKAETGTTLTSSELRRLRFLVATLIGG